MITFELRNLLLYVLCGIYNSWYTVEYRSKLLLSHSSFDYFMHETKGILSVNKVVIDLFVLIMTTFISRSDSIEIYFPV